MINGLWIFIGKFQFLLNLTNRVFLGNLEILTLEGLKKIFKVEYSL